MGAAVSRRRALLAAAASTMIVAVALAYGPARRATFIWDDHALADVSAPLRKASMSDLLTSSFLPESPLSDAHPPYYRPVTLVSLRLDADRGGEAGDFHATNIGLHLAACLLLAAVAVRLGASGVSAILAALLWGLAPRLTESVAWITGRTDVLACVFGLAAFLLSPDTGERAGSRGWRWASSIAAGFCLLAAMCSKEVALAFALAILVAALARSRAYLRGSPVERARLAAYLLGPLAIYAALRTHALAGKTAPSRDLGVTGRIGTVLEATERYVEMLLDATRPRTSIGMLAELDVGRAVLGAIVLGAIVVFVVRVGRRLATGTQAALVLTVVAIAPALHVVPLTLGGSVSADRLLYVPLAGIALAAAVEARRLSARNARAAAGACIALAVVFSTATKARAEDYTDEIGFWVTAAEHAHPHNTMARRSLAALARGAEDLELACRLYETIAAMQAESAEAGRPSHRRTRENLTACWAAEGKYEDAHRLADELARAYPDVGRVQMSLGYTLLHLRDFAAAKSAFDRAVALDPNLAPMLQPLGVQLEMAKAEWARFHDARERELDHVAWAHHLARVGRGREADAAFLAIAADSRALPDVRAAAMRYLVTDGTLESAERALRIERESDIELPVDRADLVRRGEERRARLTKLRPFRERIDALALNRRAGVGGG